MIKIRRNRSTLIDAAKVCPVFIIKGRGMRRTISISNTKKITARRKNRREKGIRALPKGSKPHSKGDAFSRSIGVRWARVKEIINTVRVRIPERIVSKDESIISLEVRFTFSGLKAHCWCLALQCRDIGDFCPVINVIRVIRSARRDI